MCCTCMLHLIHCQHGGHGPQSREANRWRRIGNFGAVSPTPPTIEPLTIRRRGVGLRGYDPERAFTGFTLFSPLPTTNKTVYLVDMLGNVVHTWNMPYAPGQSGYLTERGTLF